jgi:hypothetical protein
VDWMYTEEIQRILSMIPGAQTDAHAGAGADRPAVDFPSALELELGLSGWEPDNWMSSSSSIGVF